MQDMLVHWILLLANLYVGHGPGVPGRRVATKERLCRQCRQWYRLHERPDMACTHCDAPHPAWNPAMYTARMNGHLFEQAERAQADTDTYRRSLHEENRWRRSHGHEPVGPL